MGRQLRLRHTIISRSFECIWSVLSEVLKTIPLCQNLFCQLFDSGSYTFMSFTHFQIGSGWSACHRGLLYTLKKIHGVWVANFNFAFSFNMMSAQFSFARGILHIRYFCCFSLYSICIDSIYWYSILYTTIFKIRFRILSHLIIFRKADENRMMFEYTNFHKPLNCGGHFLNQLWCNMQ